MSDLSSLIRPTSGFLVVRPDPKAERIGMIHAPERNTLDSISGTVAVVANNLRDDYPVNTHVMYYEKAGTGMVVNGEYVLMLHESEVQCILADHAEVKAP